CRLQKPVCTESDQEIPAQGGIKMSEEKKNNDFQSTVEALFKGMDSFITTKTVVGEAIHIGENIILPLVDVSFGVAAGAFSNNAKNNGGGGMGGKITPSA